jgi:hypothetical protein
MCVGVGQGTALIVERMHAAAGMQDGEAA